MIGGTGPTGPFIIDGLLSRGWEVSTLNRGIHDLDQIPKEVERIVGDPHFEETLRQALKGRKFELMIASYGRLRMIAEIAGEYTNRLISIGGSPGYRGLRYPEALFPNGLQVPLPEDAPQVENEAEFRFGYLVRISEDSVLEGHAADKYVATHMRYPLLYGPRQPLPCDWWVIRRILDKRQNIVLPDGGLTVITRGYAENMAHAILLAIDQPEKSAGKIYNCGDNHQLTMAQWVEVIANTMDAEINITTIPAAYAFPARDLMAGSVSSNHVQFDTFALRSELGYHDKVPVLEAFKRTVDWYLKHPPSLNKATESNIKEVYQMEDSLTSIYAEMIQKLEELSFQDTEFVHPYAHPKKPGATKDHLGR